MSDDQVPDRLPDLIARHPRLFRGKPPRCHSYLLEGWFDLVDQLCTDLERILLPYSDGAAAFTVEQVKEKFGTLRFYWGLRGRPTPLQADVGGVRLAGEDTEASDEDEAGYIERIQPTPAGFRISFTPADDLSYRVSERVRAAEQASIRVCETCGAPGRLRVRRSYFFTACPAHAGRGTVTYETWRKRREAAAAGAEKVGEGGND